MCILLGSRFTKAVAFQKTGLVRGRCGRGRATSDRPGKKCIKFLPTECGTQVGNISLQRSEHSGEGLNQDSMRKPIGWGSDMGKREEVREQTKLCRALNLATEA